MNYLSLFLTSVFFDMVIGTCELISSGDTCDTDGSDGCWDYWGDTVRAASSFFLPSSLTTKGKKNSIIPYSFVPPQKNLYARAHAHKSASARTHAYKEEHTGTPTHTRIYRRTHANSILPLRPPNHLQTQPVLIHTHTRTTHEHTRTITHVCRQTGGRILERQSTRTWSILMCICTTTAIATAQAKTAPKIMVSNLILIRPWSFL